MEFDLVGVDAAIANALRRVMIAEVCNFFLYNLKKNSKLRYVYTYIHIGSYDGN